MDITIRQTKTGKYQLVRDGQPSRASVMGRDVFNTFAEAEVASVAMRERVKLAEQAEVDRLSRIAPYVDAYARLLQSPDLREMRQEIQGLYGEACHQSRLASAAQRAAIRGTGHVSCIGRDIGAVRQGVADECGSEAESAWGQWNNACHKYEALVDERMTEAGIPLFVRHGGA